VLRPPLRQPSSGRAVEWERLSRLLPKEVRLFSEKRGYLGLEGGKFTRREGWEFGKHKVHEFEYGTEKGREGRYLSEDEPKIGGCL